jgi:hypothetical protein
LNLLIALTSLRPHSSAWHRGPEPIVQARSVATRRLAWPTRLASPSQPHVEHIGPHHRWYVLPFRF